MALSWNEIKSRAIKFSKEWENEISESAESQSFWNDFFNVFGISRRRVATFERKVTKDNRKDGYIDLLWKGHLLVEQKSGGKDLDCAYKQAVDYFPGLQEHELPKYILVCNFETFRLYDLDENKQHEFKLADLINNVHLFAFIAGYQKKEYKEEDPVNIEAAEMMGKLHDKLNEIGYTGHKLEVYLVRLVFCMFADDTGIFEKGIFEEYIEQKTNVDGSDLALHLLSIFETLNTPVENRLTNLDEKLALFPYVNGKLFEERLPIASFDSEMRNKLLQCCQLDWGKISPAIFGSLFQSVMDKEVRRNLGAHYTSEKNILKLIKPLFLDDLWEEFKTVKNNKRKLSDFHDKISTLRFLDPACGCGNFLVITYRELRLLETEIIKALQKGQTVTDVFELIKIDVDRFYGIEYEEFPAQIAQLAMWLIDHQMNRLISEILGEYYVRLPLKKTPVIVQGNALRIDWHSLIDPIPWEKKPQRFDYILGNPPFIGSKLMNEVQRKEIKELFANTHGAGVVDYVTGWYIKAAEYINTYSPEKEKGSHELTKVGFVSTNSITQGEQVGILWNELINKQKIQIHFAHNTFKWKNEAKGVAAVYCVIIGFSNYDVPDKHLFVYNDINAEPHYNKAKNINPYLVDGNNVLIMTRQLPICNVPKMSFGNMPLDGGNLLLSNQEKEELIKNEPMAERFILPLISAREYLNNENRWCLWLEDATPGELRQMPLVMKRVEAVKDFREKSVAPSTQKFAVTPTLFRDRNNPNTYILIPSTTSENRKYIPMGFFGENVIANNSCHIIPEGNLYHFGVLMSHIHMVWVKYVCGKLESRYRYSKDIVYNNYPWPENPTEKQVSAIENAAQKALDVRAEYEGSSLADLYDPIAMPPKLVKAHQELDKAVDRAYRPQPFTSETNRIEFLFELYEKYTAGLFAVEKKRGRKD